ncbi:MAG: FprA family A-type flavoprotein [Candidatus Sumerlaeia bacterium]|nr:FprA family A-type flavoprotein [Candidatus Sumerlaeia bacterium]
MQAIELKPEIYWVGGIDWNLRNFHGYLTPQGSSYNAYLIMDEQITLIDLVKHYLVDELLARISGLTDPHNIKNIVVNHVEMDHSGALPKLMEITPEATIITSPNGEKALRRHYKKDWNFKVVKTGDVVKIGKRTLQFVLTPMVHWPDSMATYCPEEHILFPNDAFGQHIASTARYAEELGLDIAFAEAARYYANIIFPLGELVLKVLNALTPLTIDIIAPSHGVIWRNPAEVKLIISAYEKWAKHETEANRAVIVYDTLWGATEQMAYTLREGLEDAGIEVSMCSLQTNHISSIMTEVLFSRFVLIGSPTINNSFLPTVGAFLTYLKGLRPKQRIGLAFGSYGWSGQGAKDVETILKELGWNLPEKLININYIPDPSELAQVRETALRLATHSRQ